MQLRNCPRCGKLFVYYNHEICRDCFAREQEDFYKVRAYLEKHPGANIWEIHQQTGVKYSVLKRFCQSGRLEGRRVARAEGERTFPEKK